MDHVDGVMRGREAYQRPYILSLLIKEFFNVQDKIPERLNILEHFLPYVDEELKHGTALRHITRHILGLFQSQPRRQKISTVSK